MTSGGRSRGHTVGLLLVGLGVAVWGCDSPAGVDELVQVALSSSGPCPTAEWNNCRLMTNWEWEQMQFGMSDAADLGGAHCQEGINAITQRRNDHPDTFWIYEYHDGDDNESTVWGHVVPGAVGFRWDLFINEQELGVTGVHEGYHLADRYHDDGDTFSDPCAAD